MAEDTTAATADSPESPLQAAGRELLAELDHLFVERRRNEARIANALARARRLELHKLYGYSSLSAMAWDRYGHRKSKTSELIAIVEGSKELPATRAAFEAGALEWTKARELCKIAKPENELEWLAKSDEMTANQLRAERTGEPLKVTRVLTFTPEQVARFDQVMAEVQDRLNLSDAGQAVLALLEGAGETLGESATPRVVITECGSCGEATSESREGPVPVERAAVEAARCSGEVHDLREPENVVTRAVPAKVRRRVFDRDRRRCQVPRCTNLCFLDVHHEDGWRSGHEPSRMLVMCQPHHRQRHDGWLVIEGEAPNFRFKTRGGVVLEAGPTPAKGSPKRPGFSCENPRDGRSPSSARESAA